MIVHLSKENTRDKIGRFTKIIAQKYTKNISKEMSDLVKITTNQKTPFLLKTAEFLSKTIKEYI